MTEFTAHRPGTVSWVELATTDQKAGVAFYRDLFDWEVIDQPIGPTEAVLDVPDARPRGGRRVTRSEPTSGTRCALALESLRDGGEQVDESARRAQELGGTLLAPPFDVMDAGRMAVVQDPTGAIIQLWEAKRSIGAKILGEPGALCWSELTTRDPDTARTFYTSLFGWTARESGTDAAMPYTEFSNEGQPGHGHDEDAGADARARPVLLDALLPSGQLRRGYRQGDPPWCHGHRPADRYPQHRPVLDPH